MHQRKLVHLQKLLLGVILACAQIFLLQSISCISASAHGTHHWEDDCPSSKFPYFPLFVMFPKWSKCVDDCESKLTEAWHLGVTMAQGICMQCDSVTSLKCEEPRFTVKNDTGDGEYSHRCGQELGYISVQSGDLPFSRFLLTCASQWALKYKSTLGTICAFGFIIAFHIKRAFGMIYAFGAIR